MTQREVTASPVSVFSQVSTGALQSHQMRTQQTSNFFKQLGVVLQEQRQHETEELADKTRAETENQAMVIEATTRPQIEEMMRDPAMYEMSPEDFLKSEAYKLGAEALATGISAPKHREALMAKYKEGMLAQYTEGRVKLDYEKRERGHSIAQKASASRGSIELQMRAYDNSLKAGVSKQDAFMAGLAAASMEGPEYLKKFSTARNWTPEEQARIAAELASQQKAYNMEANVALKLAHDEQDTYKKLAALQDVQQRFSASLSNDQNASLIADITTATADVAAERQIRASFGRVSIDDMANGIGVSGRRQSVGDIKRWQDEEFTAALHAGNVVKMTQMLAIPHDEPAAAKRAFTSVFGSLASATRDNPQAVEKALMTAGFIEKALNPARMRTLLGSEMYSDYQQLKHMTAYGGLGDAVEQFKLANELRAKGPITPPKNWSETRRRVIEHTLKAAQGNMFERLFGAGGDSMTRGSVSAQLAPFFETSLALGRTEDQMIAVVDQMLEGSAWNGYLNGGVLGDSLKALTKGDKGNPYGDRTEIDLWNEFKKLKLKELQEEVNPNYQGLEIVIGEDPSTLYLTDKSGLTVPRQFMTVKSVIEQIRAQIPTTKQEIMNARGDSP